MGVCCSCGPQDLFISPIGSHRVVHETDNSRSGLALLGVRSAAGSAAHSFVTSASGSVIRLILEFAGDGQIHFDKYGFAEELTLRPDACAIARSVGTTGMRSCLLNASYPRLWVQFSVERLHPSRFLHIGLARALEGPDRRRRACAMPLDRWAGYCFKLSDGCFYGADGSKWSTDYADGWGFNVPLRSVGILADFPHSQSTGNPLHLSRRQRGDSGSVASSLVSLPGVGGGISVSGILDGSVGAGAVLSATTSTGVAFASSPSSVVDSAGSRSGAAIAPSGHDDDVVSTVARRKRHEGTGSGSIMFTVNGRIVMRTQLLRDGNRRSAGQRIRSLEEARARARDASRKLRRTYQVNRNRIRGERGGGFVVDSSVPHLAAGSVPVGLSTIAETMSVDHRGPLGGSSRGIAAGSVGAGSSRVPHSVVSVERTALPSPAGSDRSLHSAGSWVHHAAALSSSPPVDTLTAKPTSNSGFKPTSTKQPAESGPASAAASAAASASSAVKDEESIQAASGTPRSPQAGSPFAFSEVPGWYGSWRIAVSLGGIRDVVSLGSASTLQPQVLDDFLGL